MSIKVGDLVRIKHNRAEIMELRLTEERCSNIVSPNSPVGQALLGKQKGDKFQAYTPDGIAEVEVLEVNAGDALPQMGGLMQ